MSKTVTSPKGNQLPLTNLKGKDYLMVAYRIQWLNEDTTVAKFDIATDFVLLNDDQTIARAKVSLYDQTGALLRSATATKRETKKDFSDHTEKAETSAIGRALAMLGYGTQFAIADLDEGERLADSPLEKTDASVTKSSFRKKPSIVSATPEVATPEVTAPTATVTATAVAKDGWE